MKVSDILRVKGNTLFTIRPDQPLAQAGSYKAVARNGAIESEPVSFTVE